ncbi:MAG: metallophosphoesterase family protein [Streptosporangiaceae bacterium]
MKIGIVSDVHGDHEGLKLVVDAFGAIDELWCAGDVVNGYRFSHETYEFLRARKARIVMGNHDEEYLKSAASRSVPKNETELRNQRAAGCLAAQVEAEFNGKRLLMTHGSPVGPRWQYVHETSARVLSAIGELGYDIVILGHTHVPMAIRAGGTLIINPGSCSELRTPRNRDLLTGVVINTETEDVDLIGIPDPRFPDAGQGTPRRYEFEEFRSLRSRGRI